MTKIRKGEKEMKKTVISLLAALLLVTTGAAAVFAEDEEPKDPDCIGEECEIAPYYIPCDSPECLDLD